MPSFQFVADLLANRKFKKLSQTQNEALVDVLTAAKAIDGQLRDVERRELLEIVDRLDWKSGTSVEGYIDESVQRATDIEPVPGQLEDFFEEVGARLDEDWVRREAYYLAARIVLADDEIVDNERLLLQHLVAGFDIDPEKQQIIMRKIRDEVEV